MYVGQKKIREDLKAKTEALIAVEWAQPALKEAAQKWLDTYNDGDANQAAAKAYVAALEEGICTVEELIACGDPKFQAHGEALKNPAIIKMAEKYGVSAAQLCIRYVLQLGAVALPKTADLAHMESNADVDFAISEEDMETLKNMERIANYGEFSAFPVFSGKPLA